MRRNKARKIMWFGAILSVALVYSATVSAADVVVTKDGSRIVGTVTGMADGNLSIDTAAAGTVSVKFDQIESMDTDHDIIVALNDGKTALMGRPKVSGGRLTMDTAMSGSIPVDMANVAAINPPDVPAVRHSGFVALNGKITDGNTRTKAVGAVAEYVARAEKSRLTIGADWNYAQDRGALTARNASAGIKYDLFLTEKFFAYVNASVKGDEFADLNLRSTLGAGVGYQFIEEADLKYYEEVGVSYFDENFDVAKDESYAAGRLAGKVDWNVKPGKLTFFHQHEVFFGFDDSEDVYVDTKQGIRVQLMGNLFATAQVNFSWDNTPAAGTNRRDTVYLWGLGYNFDF